MTNINVTDHALVRYMECVHNVDTEAFREALRSEVSSTAAAVGAAVGGYYAVKRGGYRYICEGNRIITVLRRGPTPTRREGP
jgi:hypothetical protein